MKKNSDILCIGINQDEWRMEALNLDNEHPPLAVTWVNEAAETAAALQDIAHWDLILCDATVYYRLKVDAPIKTATTKCASLILIRRQGANLSPAEAFRRGAADLVVDGDLEHLRMIVERELANARDRRELAALRQQRAAPAMPAAAHKPTPAPVEPIAAPEQAKNDAERAQDLRVKELIEGGGLTLEYQPIMALDSGAELKAHAIFEALLRLKDGSGQLLRPQEFFPVAARNRWLAKLDHWVFNRALKTLSQMQANAAATGEGAAVMSLSLNLSTDTLSNDAGLQPILQLIDKATIQDGTLIVEISKDSLTEHAPMVMRLSQILKSRGHGLLLEKFDDSDCELLINHEGLIDYVKLNCRFLNDATSPKVMEQQLRQMAECALERKVKIIALAVDNANILPLLYSIGIDYIQGFFVSIPYSDLVYPNFDVVEI